MTRVSGDGMDSDAGAGCLKPPWGWGPLAQAGLGVSKDDVDRAMASAINQIAHVMSIQTVAECAETDAIPGILKQLGIDHAQGYAIAAPRPLEELRARGNAGQAPA